MSCCWSSMATARCATRRFRRSLRRRSSATCMRWSRARMLVLWPRRRRRSRASPRCSSPTRRISTTSWRKMSRPWRPGSGRPLRPAVPVVPRRQQSLAHRGPGAGDRGRRRHHGDRHPRRRGHPLRRLGRPRHPRLRLPGHDPLHRVTHGASARRAPGAARAGIGDQVISGQRAAQGLHHQFLESVRSNAHAGRWFCSPAAQRRCGCRSSPASSHSPCRGRT